MSSEPTPHTWATVASQLLKAVAESRTVDRILQLAIIAIGIYVANLSGRNNDRIEAVQGRQKEATEQAVEAKQEAAVVKQTLLKSNRDMHQVNEVQLWSTYQYLKDIAVSTGDPRDAVKAAEAKAVYDEYRKQNGN